MTEKELYQQIYTTKEQLGNLLTEHWQLYSNMTTWYFWVNLVILIVPFIVLYMYVDRKRIFEVAFYGYSIHILWYNVDGFLTGNNYMNHPHSLTTFLPESFTVSAVFFPISFLLLYQYCTNNGKNYYIYSVIGSFIFAFGFGGISLLVELLRFHKGMNLFYLFLIDIVIVLTALAMTKVFFWIKNTRQPKRFSD
ncbi:hypothetical protein ACFO3D_09515 [Virgibacillus kekensis]|uniref:Uncharacterized protein n=1 Tax=Virgibacillus kekensis TaxID=202261 RepID=A0ABV9DLH5_9BACI